MIPIRRLGNDLLARGKSVEADACEAARGARATEHQPRTSQTMTTPKAAPASPAARTVTGG